MGRISGSKGLAYANRFVVPPLTDSHCMSSVFLPSDFVPLASLDLEEKDRVGEGKGESESERVLWTGQVTGQSVTGDPNERAVQEVGAFASAVSSTVKLAVNFHGVVPLSSSPLRQPHPGPYREGLRRSEGREPLR